MPIKSDFGMYFFQKNPIKSDFGTIFFKNFDKIGFLDIFWAKDARKAKKCQKWIFDKQKSKKNWKKLNNKKNNNRQVRKSKIHNFCLCLGAASALHYK